MDIPLQHTDVLFIYIYIYIVLYFGIYYSNIPPREMRRDQESIHNRTKWFSERIGAGGDRSAGRGNRHR